MIRLGILAAIIAGLVSLWIIMKKMVTDYTEVIMLFNTEEVSEYDMEDAEAYDAEMDDTDEEAGHTLEVYVNAQTSYKVVLEDDALLLDDAQAKDLAALMQEITSYGNVAFKTIDDNSQSTESYARQYYQEQFGTASGTLFLIDMDNRNLWIHSDGTVYTVITKSYANTITDNVYRYASNGDYYDCASQTYEQILTLLKGHKIAQPMKYISNGLLAVILALLLNYGLVSFFSRLRKPGRKELLGSGRNHFHYTQPKVFYTRESRVYNPSSSGSGSGGSSSGGSSSGRSSGGGGGHSF